MKHKYQEEYETTVGLFWENKPAKYVRLFTESINHDLTNFSVLDLGAGEGKNAVYLASLGSRVIAIDISSIALSKFSLQNNFEQCKNNIDTINCNILDVDYEECQFDLVIAYGILHCLSNQKQIELIIGKIKKWIKPNGYFIGATFTNKIPPPDIQEYLEFDSFLPEGTFEQLFAKWKIIYSEDEIITETHPTSKIPHEHSITRLIAQKI